MVRGIGILLVKQFDTRMVKFDSRVETLMSRMEAGGWLDEGKRNLLTSVFTKTLLAPHVSVPDISVVFNKINVKGVEEKDSIALVKYFTGRLGTLAFRNVFKYHPQRYQINARIFSLLTQISNDADEDRFRLGIGRSDYKTYKFEEQEAGEDYRLFTDETYIYRVGSQLGQEDSNYQLLMRCIADKAVNVEMFYPERNILVMTKEDYSEWNPIKQSMSLF